MEEWKNVFFNKKIQNNYNLHGLFYDLLPYVQIYCSICRKEKNKLFKLFELEKKERKRILFLNL